MPHVHAELSSLFGYSSFRPHQEEVVRSILGGRDCFTVMPTGAGKSLCYQLPARLLPGACVVISPLISLMKDQVDAARQNGLTAAALNSTSAAEEKSAVRRAMQAGELDLLYISPERLHTPGFSDWLRTVPIAFFAIDEAHCISEWGHDFRPDYLALSSLSADFPGIPVAAFTATATRRVEDDIIQRLALRKPLRIRASFNRPNLFYKVSPKEKLEAQLLDIIRAYPGQPGIIYCTTRKTVEKLTAALRAAGVQALPYHAGLGTMERAAAQEAFRDDICPVIIATVAFGMGIDKSNVRYVIHADLPKSLENYYQETGRAGRDGEAAHCTLLYGRQDIAQLLRFADRVEEAAAREAARQQAFSMLDFTQKDGCRRKALLAYFNEDFPVDNCGGCDVCLGEVQREDATVPAQMLLSAIARTGGRFGGRHIISIVMGVENPVIVECGHDSLPTFGVGRAHDLTFWRRVLDAVLAQGLAHVDDARFPLPAITERGWELLRGTRTCSLVKVAEQVAGKSTQQRKARQAADIDEADRPLFERLRELRTRLARDAGVPPYMVFSDRTLREMAQIRPRDNEAMLAVSGVGERKLAVYGREFLQIIAE